MWLFWLFLALPMIEIALFIKIGGVIGLWATLALVLFSAALGLSVIRAQGARTATELQRSLNEFRDPSRPMAHGALIILGGLLLIFPGFFTDIVGLSLMIPFIRDLVLRRIVTRMGGRQATMRAGARHDPYRPPFADGVIDGDYIDEDEIRARHDPADQPGPPDAPLPPPHRGQSGWTRH